MHHICCAERIYFIIQCIFLDGDDHEIIKIPKGDRLTIPCSNDGGIYDQLGALFWKRNNSVLVSSTCKLMSCC